MSLTFHVLELEAPPSAPGLPRWVVLERDSATLHSQEVACCYTREHATRVRSALAQAQEPTTTITRNLCPECREYRDDMEKAMQRDPTPFCLACGAMREESCNCGPIADNN